MTTMKALLFILVSIVSIVGALNSVVPLDLGRKVQVNCLMNISVDQTGRGNFRNIQAAVDSIPPSNKNWICIYVNQGEYRYMLHNYST